jgi:glutathione S-transferase
MMAIDPNASIEITAFSWVPEGAQGLVKDLRVRWALEEAGLDYSVRLIGGERPAGYAEDQPFNQVPCLRDGTIRIFESGAIVQYISERCKALLPCEAEARYRAIQWTYAAVNSIEPFVQFRALLTGFWAGEAWAGAATSTFDQLARLRLQQLSDRLEGKQWLEGDRFTIGDLMMVTVLRIADRSGQLADFPTLSAYVKRGQARPAFARALNDQLAAFAANEPQAEGAAA